MIQATSIFFKFILFLKKIYSGGISIELTKTSFKRPDNFEKRVGCIFSSVCIYLIQNKLAMKNFFGYCISIAAIAICSTHVFAQRSATENAQLWNLYQSAVLNSEYTDSAKIWNGLQTITHANHNLVYSTINGEEYILVVTWKAVNYYVQTNTAQPQPYNTQGYDMWVTTAPELKQKVRTTKPTELELRLEQLLGLPPVENYYKYFFEFWVRPQDLYRPCADNEITDNACQIAFPPNVTPEFVSWVDSQRISRFFGGDPKTRYPWTELGYTYDWSPANTTHRGCSEFVIKKFATIYQRHFYSTSEYIYGVPETQSAKEGVVK